MYAVAFTFNSQLLRLLSLGMLFLPRIDPIRDTAAIALDIAILLTIQFHHDLFIVGFTRFFEENAEDLGV